MVYQEAYQKLCGILEEMGSVAVAFSGGVDSAFLLKAASEANCRVVAMTAFSSFIPKKEQEEATELAGQLEVPHIICRVPENVIDPFRHNPPDRCYHCKRAIFGEFVKTASENDLAYVVEGSNLDDDNDYRPGMRAIKELGVRSPLKEAGFTKEMIRAVSHELGLNTWNKPSYACLASRIPYGDTITPDKLRMAELAEDMLHEMDFKQCRVRVHDRIARIELMPSDMEGMLDAAMREKIDTYFKSIGFAYVALDLKGYRTGSLNEVL
ncbi:MAG: ATP-dependent sacrificial sulfur transferase LarE [Lachnospiraceae bacterium]|nr:ATP-dependent sacrificial sulfur transferase LarE [Candidatus Equihabitans merdae]